MSENQLFCADCAYILDSLPTASVDMFLEDMPYNTTHHVFEYAVDLNEYWRHRLRVIKDNGAIILTAQQPFATALISSQPKLFRYELIWEKTKKLGFLNANRMPMRSHENILIFYKALPVYHPQKVPGKPVNRQKPDSLPANRYAGYGKTAEGLFHHRSHLRFPGSVIQSSNNIRQPIHGTQKPVDLFRWLIRTYTNENDLVFDGYGGSFTTAIACIRENRRYICCEWDQAQFLKSQRRVDHELQQKKLS